MEKRSIGQLNVSVIGLGCNNFGWRLNEKDSHAVIDAAIEAGINFFDTADTYDQGESERIIGTALKGRREQVVLATKFAKPMKGVGSGASARYIRTAVESSLKRLQTDYIDLYQQHQPDLETPLDETSETLAALMNEGKVREVGYSNFDAKLLREAQASMLKFGKYAVSLQNEYSMLNRDVEDSVLAECERQNVVFLPYYPLASGMLTGKYRKGKPLPAGTRIFDNWGKGFLTDSNLEKVEQLSVYASSRGYELLDVAFAWLLSRPVAASVIAGATSASQVRRNAAAAQWQLTSTDLSEIDSIVP